MIAKSVADQGRSVRLCEADNFHMRGTEYVFQAAQQNQAHFACQLDAYDGCRTNKDLVIVSNTMTTRKEIEPYVLIAERCCYELHAIWLKAPHDSSYMFNRNTHGVPDEVLARQLGNLVTEAAAPDSPLVNQVIFTRDVTRVKVNFTNDKSI